MSFFDELTSDERRALDSIDLTPILGTPRERMQLVLHKAMEYMRQAQMAKADERRAWRKCDVLTEALRKFVAFHDADHETLRGEEVQALYDEAINTAKEVLGET